MKKPIFKDCSFNFNYDGCFYNVKFIPTGHVSHYKIVVQDFNGTGSLFEDIKFIETLNKTTALHYLKLALKTDNCPFCKKISKNQ